MHGMKHTTHNSSKFYLYLQIQCPAQKSNFLGYLQCMRVISKVTNSSLAWAG